MYPVFAFHVQEKKNLDTRLGEVQWMQLTILLCKSAGLHKGDLSVRLQVSLVTHHHYDDIGAGQSPGVRQPVCQCIVCPTAGEEMEKQVRREREDWEREDSEERRKDKEVKGGEGEMA